jgi:hypothetical protein
MRPVIIRPSVRALTAGFVFFAAVITGFRSIDGLLKRQVDYSRRGGPSLIAKQDRDPLVFWTFVSIYGVFSLGFVTLGTTYAAQVFRQIRSPSTHGKKA